MKELGRLRRVPFFFIVKRNELAAPTRVLEHEIASQVRRIPVVEVLKDLLFGLDFSSALFACHWHVLCAFLRRIKGWAAGPMLLALSCATTHKVAVQQTSESEVQSNTETTTTTQTGPERTTTTVEEFAAPEEVMPSEPDDGMAEVPKQRGRAVTRGVAADAGHGPLVKRTVTITEKAPATQIVESKAQQESTTQGATTTKTEDTSRPAGIWLLLSIVWPWALVGGLCAAGLALWRWRGGWVPVVLGLFKKKA